VGGHHHQAGSGAAQEGTRKPRSEVEGTCGSASPSEIVRCTRFWEQPDPGQDESFGDWLSASSSKSTSSSTPSRSTRGAPTAADLYALEILDGSTIKPLRDYRGGRPAPPNPAFQQILWGFPRGEFIADTDGDGNVVDAYPADQLIYKRRNVRAHTPYGYSRGRAGP
jgi:hypothetical protein